MSGSSSCSGLAVAVLEHLEFSLLIDGYGDESNVECAMANTVNTMELAYEQL